VDAEDLEGIANHRDNLLNELIHGGWVDGKGRPIYDWKAFVSGLNDTIQPRR